MLSDTLYRIPRHTGLTVIQGRGPGHSRELTSRRLLLDAGQSAAYDSPDEETVIVLQEGAGDWGVGEPALVRLARERVHRARHGAVSAAGRRAPRDGDHADGSDSDVDARAAPRAAPSPRWSGRPTCASTRGARGTTRAKCTTCSSTIRTPPG